MDSVNVPPDAAVVEDGEPLKVNVEGLTNTIVALVEGVPPEVT